MPTAAMQRVFFSSSAGDTTRQRGVSKAGRDADRAGALTAAGAEEVVDDGDLGADFSHSSFGVAALLGGKDPCWFAGLFLVVLRILSVQKTGKRGQHDGSGTTEGGPSLGRGGCCLDRIVLRKARTLLDPFESQSHRRDDFLDIRQLCEWCAQATCRSRRRAQRSTHPEVCSDGVGVLEQRRRHLFVGRLLRFIEGFVAFLKPLVCTIEFFVIDGRAVGGTAECFQNFAHV